MNRQCEFDEFKDIMKAAFLEESKDPHFRWKLKISGDQFASPNSALTPETFVESEVTSPNYLIICLGLRPRIKTRIPKEN